MRHPDRRSRRAPQAPKRTSRAYRPSVESLEDRTLLSTTTIDPLQVPLNLPVGKSLIVPVSGSNSAGGPVSYSVSTNDPHIIVVPHTGDTFLQMTVAGFGTMEFELFNDLTPNTVNYISGLVQSEFYNGLTFHRITTSSSGNGGLAVIQGGDPTGTGTGGPPGAGATPTQLAELQFDDEFNSQAIFDGLGQLAMAKSNNDTNGSQFFVTNSQPRSLDFKHTIFGQLIRGFDVLKAIDAVPTNPAGDGTPTRPVVITSAQIIQDPTAQVFTLTSTDTSPTPFTLTVTATAADGTQATQMMNGQVFTDTADTPNNFPGNDPPFLSTITVTSPSGTQTITNPNGFRVNQNGVTPLNVPATVQLSSTDLENDVASYTLTITDTTAHATIAPTGSNSTGTFIVTPNTGFTGVIHLQASVTETGATRAADTENFTLAVGDMALTPGGSSASVSTTEGASTGSTTLGTFADADTANSQASDFQVAINWGDGTALDHTTGVVTGTGGNFTVSGQHTYAEAGKFVAKVTVTDAHTGTAGTDQGGAQATLTTNATVADAPLTSQGVAVADSVLGIPLSNTEVATFTDADPGAKAGDFSVSIDWGDGAVTSGTVVAAGSGQFKVLGSHTYGAPSTFNIGVSVADNNTAGFVPVVTTSSRTTARVVSLPERFVTRAFLDLTGAPPTPVELVQFEGLLAVRGRLAVALAIQRLPAYRVHEIVRLYVNLFGVGPNAHQLQSGLKFLAHRGQSIVGLARQLLASDLFFRTRGHHASGRFLDAAATFILGPSMNTAPLTVLREDLRAGVTRDAIIRVLESLPAATTQRLQDVNVALLGRLGTNAELATELGQLGSSGSLDFVIANLVASDTYLQRVLTGS